MKPSIIYIGNKVSNSQTNPTTHNKLVENLTAEEFKVFSASSKTNKIIRLLEMIWVFLKNRSQSSYVLIDVYSTQNFWYAVILSKLSILFEIKYIPILHGGDLISRFNRSKKASTSLLAKAFVIVSPSKYLKEEVSGLAFNNVVYIPNSLDLKSYKFKLRKELRPKLLWVRAFDEIYNPMMAIKAFQLIHERFPNAHLCMVGPDKDGTLEICKKYALSNNLNITFKGKLKKEKWIQLSDDFSIFLNTSFIDNIPVSVLEAMALGLPVISTNVGGISYIIEGGKSGALVNAGDELAMSKAICYLLENQESAQKISLDAKLNLENYSWEYVKNEWFKILN